MLSHSSAFSVMPVWGGSRAFPNPDLAKGSSCHLEQRQSSQTILAKKTKHWHHWHSSYTIESMHIYNIYIWIYENSPNWHQHTWTNWFCLWVYTCACKCTFKNQYVYVYYVICLFKVLFFQKHYIPQPVYKKTHVIYKKKTTHFFHAHTDAILACRQGSNTTSERWKKSNNKKDAKNDGFINRRCFR